MEQIKRGERRKKIMNEIQGKRIDFLFRELEVSARGTGDSIIEMCQCTIEGIDRE
jgi:hypothetical protein